MDQFEPGFPYVFFQGGACSPSLDDQGLEAAAAPPTQGSRLGAVRGADQSQARLRHINQSPLQARTAVLFTHAKPNGQATGRTIARRLLRVVRWLGGLYQGIGRPPTP